MGHSPPYAAVITLAVMTAHHWRAIRLKLTLAGITNPMNMPSMHILFDTTEMAILEAMQGDNPRDGEMKRTQFIDRLYAPAPEVDELNGEDYEAQPEGFEADDVEASFDAFIQAARQSDTL